MKKIKLLIIIFSVCAITGFQCEKDVFFSGCLRGRVIDAFCADYIIQVTSGSYDTSLVVSSWPDPVTGITYNNVFSVQNFCELQKALIQPGSEISFRIGGHTSSNSCITCMGLRPTPDKKNVIKLSACF